MEVDKQMTEKKDADHQPESKIKKISRKSTEKKSEEIDSAVSEEPIDAKGGKEDETNQGSSSLKPEEAESEKPEKQLRSLLEQKEEELLQKHDHLLRTQAEFENYKKRTIREKADLMKFGNEALMSELLSIIDALERSLEHAHRSNQKDALVDGIELVKKELLKKLEKFGLKQIATQGETFDPHKHEAIAQIETAEYPENAIIEELQKGYLVHDRLLRPATVRVTKAPPPLENEATDAVGSDET